MRKIMMAMAAILSVSGAANAADNDWGGSVKAQAAYLDPNNAQVDITVDVMFDDSTGPQHGLAWGTMTYMRGVSTGLAKLTAYYHAVCVGRIDNTGNKLSVSAVLVKEVGSQALPLYMTYEFDLLNKKWRTNGATTLAGAQDNCKTQSGLFPGTFDHGYVVVK